MSWTTPKTNWAANDYYNLEDAQRIAGNICYLKSMAQDIYDVSTPCLIKKERLSYFNVIIYAIKYVNLDNIYDTPVVQPSEYTYNMISWLDNDTTNLSTFIKLMMLSDASGVADHGSLKVPGWYNKDTTSQSTVDAMPVFSDPCILVDSSTMINSTPLYNMLVNRGIGIFNFHVFYDNLPLSSRFSGTTSSTSKGYAEFSNYASKLYNQPFWNYEFFNDFEYRINVVYNKFTRYLGG